MLHAVFQPDPIAFAALGVMLLILVAIGLWVGPNSEATTGGASDRFGRARRGAAVLIVLSLLGVAVSSLGELQRLRQQNEASREPRVRRSIGSWERMSAPEFVSGSGEIQLIRDPHTVSADVHVVLVVSADNDVHHLVVRRAVVSDQLLTVGDTVKFTAHARPHNHKSPERHTHTVTKLVRGD